MTNSTKCFSATKSVIVVVVTKWFEKVFNWKLYARNANNRIKVTDPSRETVIDGDFNDKDTLNQAMDGVDAVYLNEMRDLDSVKNIVAAMDANHVRQFIGATVLGIEDEVKGAFGQWNTSMIESSITKRIKTAKVIKDSDLTYTLLRLAWLYNKDGNTNYELTDSDQPFGGTQVTPSSRCPTDCQHLAGWVPEVRPQELRR